MKRIHNRSRYAAMLSSQLVERRNSNRIAKNDSDLPAFLTQCGLTLRAGFKFCHGSDRCHEAAHEVDHVIHRHPTRDRLNGRNTICSVCGSVYTQQAVLSAGADSRINCTSSEGNVTKFDQGIHSYIRSREILPMCESYIVTSDMSTGRAA